METALQDLNGTKAKLPRSAQAASARNAYGETQSMMFDVSFVIFAYLGLQP